MWFSVMTDENDIINKSGFDYEFSRAQVCPLLLSLLE